MSLFKDKTLLITGGTGSFGNARAGVELFPKNQLRHCGFRGARVPL